MIFDDASVGLFAPDLVFEVEQGSNVLDIYKKALTDVAITEPNQLCTKKYCDDLFNSIPASSTNQI